MTTQYNLEAEIYLQDSIINKDLTDSWLRDAERVRNRLDKAYKTVVEDDKHFVPEADFHLLASLKCEGRNGEAAKKAIKVLRKKHAKKDNGAYNKGERDTDDISAIMALLLPVLGASLRAVTKREKSSLLKIICSCILPISTLTRRYLARIVKGLKTVFGKRYSRSVLS